MKIKVAGWPQALVILLSCGMAFAQDGPLRVSLLPKVSLEGRSTAHEAFENALAAALSAKGARIVDLAQAKDAQRLAWSDRVQAGQLPEGSNLFFTDMLYSAQLDCSQIAANVLDTSIMTLQCMLNSKIVRADSGDIAFTDSLQLTQHGLTAANALKEVLGKRLAELLDPLATRALAQVQSSESWSLDLVVSELGDRALAEHLTDVLEGLPGVSVARMTMYRAGLVQYVISGRGAPELAALGAGLESNRDLALSLIFQSPRSLHARFDLARSLPRPIMVLGLVEQPEAAPGRELPLLRAALSLVPYLEPAHSSPMLASLRSETKALQGVTQRARKLAVPLILQLTLVERKAVGWVASSALIDVATKRPLLQTAKSNPTPEAALSEALQALDQQYRSGLGGSALQTRLGISSHVRAAPSDGLVVDAFRLVQKDGQSFASLKLRNKGIKLASEVQARIRSNRQLLAQRSLAPISAAGALDHEIALQAVAHDGAPELELEIDYQLGDERRQVASQLLTAEGNALAPLGDDVSTAYEEMFRTARRLYDAGEWQESLVLFAQVYEKERNARVACALGFVELDLRNLDAARKHLEESLASQVRPLSAAQRREVTRALRWIDESGPAGSRALIR